MNITVMSKGSHYCPYCDLRKTQFNFMKCEDLQSFSKFMPELICGFSYKEFFTLGDTV